MPKQRRMNKQARLELVRSYREEYMSAGRGRRGEILSCLQGSTNYNRKYLIHLLRVIFEAHDGICPARIHPTLRRIRHRLRQDEPRLLRRRPRPRNERRRQIYAQIERLFHLPNAVPGITGDVHDTLTFPLSS